MARKIHLPMQAILDIFTDNYIEGKLINPTVESLEYIEELKRLERVLIYHTYQAAESGMYTDVDEYFNRNFHEADTPTTCD